MVVHSCEKRTSIGHPWNVHRTSFGCFMDVLMSKLKPSVDVHRTSLCYLWVSIQTWVLTQKRRNTGLRRASTVIQLYREKKTNYLFNVMRRNEGFRTQGRNNFNIFRELSKKTALFNYPDYNAAPRSADCAEVKVPSGSFKELDSLILTFEVLNYFSAVSCGRSREQRRLAALDDLPDRFCDPPSTFMPSRLRKR